MSPTKKLGDALLDEDDNFMPLCLYQSTWIAGPPNVSHQDIVDMLIGVGAKGWEPWLMLKGAHPETGQPSLIIYLKRAVSASGLVSADGRKLPPMSRN